MPTYSYACTSCDNAFDIVQSMSEDSLTQCPKCQGRLRKLFNNVGVMFKGSGFYRTDSRSSTDSSSSSTPSPPSTSTPSAPATPAAPAAPAAPASPSTSSS
ncbi:unannotated protein [freshwater metagenome]|uniref:Unannotated protein n=1 Tax=freshwater metagenome TaxID=449393 RepID=A0A6J7GX73_9ZZZZ|nr:FmdB family transcriptional regulator [Actinomycetota bacterium]